MAVEHILDVSQLEPCEPLQRTLAALTTLARGEYLWVLHRMEPYPLYRLLTQQGFTWLTQPGEIVPVEIFIWHNDDVETETVVKARTIKSLTTPGPALVRRGVSSATQMIHTSLLSKEGR